MYSLKIATGIKNLFEFGHYLVHFIVRVSTAAVGIYGFTTVATGAPIFIQKWILGRTSAFKFTVFQEYESDRHHDEKES
jgi:hypothetical protein